MSATWSAQSVVMDEERWLKELDASIERSLREMEPGGGRHLDGVFDELLADIRESTDRKQH